jgi:hypothetical protein
MSEHEELSLEEIKHIDQIFEFFDIEDGQGARVAPVTYSQAPTDTRLAIFIRGEHQLASIIMAELMSKLQDLSDIDKQTRQAEEKRVITPDKRIITPT